MKRLLASALLGTVCFGAAQQAIAGPDPAPSPTPALSPPNAGATPLPRKAYLPRLQAFYGRGRAIYAKSMSDKLTDQEVDLRFKEFMDWANDAGTWMNGAISPAATERFTTWRMEVGKARKLAGNHPDAESNKFRSLTTVLPQLLENLKFLMTPGAVESLRDDPAASR